MKGLSGRAAMIESIVRVVSRLRQMERLSGREVGVVGEVVVGGLVGAGRGA